MVPEKSIVTKSPRSTMSRSSTGPSCAGAPRDRPVHLLVGYGELHLLELDAEIILRFDVGLHLDERGKGEGAPFLQRVGVDFRLGDDFEAALLDRLADRGLDEPDRKSV